MSAIEKVLLEHGSGSGLSQLFSRVIRPHLLPRFDGVFEDSALLGAPGGALAFTTDSFVVRPLEFSGGNIGTLAACGTINDLAMSGATPKWMAVSLIIEEGLDSGVLARMLDSLRTVCDGCGVSIACGDTKVVERGHGNGLYITTTGIGVADPQMSLSAAHAREGDAVIVSGEIGAHGIAVLAARHELSFVSGAVSDCRPLLDAARQLCTTVPQTRVMRDATRGGCAAVLNEIAADSGVTIRLRQADVPVSPVVAGACSFLGFDPLHIANEGTFVAIVPSSETAKALGALRELNYCVKAGCIGTVEKRGRFPVVIETEIGGSRQVEIPSGRILPRIC